MKKKAMLAMAIIMLLGSVKALATSSQGSIDPVEMENVNGKWDASELNVNLATVKADIKEMQRMQESLSEVGDTNGLMSALGQSIEIAESLSKEVSDKQDVEKSRELVKTVHNTVEALQKQMKKMN